MANLFAPVDPATLAPLAAAVHGYYAAFARRLDPEQALGGHLLFAGELSEESSPLLRASGIVSLGSLVVSADSVAQREALRTGIIDILVNNLDEALRILKVEIRKHQAVSVLVAGDPAAIAAEMLERGAQPDFIAAKAPQASRFMELGAVAITPAPLPAGQHLHTLALPESYRGRQNEFDSTLATLLDPADHLGRRWLRLAPRFLGPSFRRFRSICLADEKTTALDELLKG